MTYERPNVLPWPPIILVLAVICAVTLHYVLPLEIALITTSWVGRVCGGLVGLVGAALDILAVVTMRRAQTNILPHKAADTLVTHGVFSVSRNPIYSGNTLMLAGASGLFANGWFLIAAVAAGVAVYNLAIKREEAHLSEKFGSEWTAYCNRTPRWLFV